MRSLACVCFLAVRSSPALLALPCLLGLELGVVLLQGTDWTAEWRWAIDWAGAGVFLAAPFAAGLAAWQSQVTSRSIGEAVQPLRSPGRVFAFNAGGVLVCAAAGHLVVVALVVATVYRAGAGGIPDLAPVLLHWLFLAAAVAIGYAAGQVAETRLLAPCLALVVLFCVIEASNGSLPTLWVEVAGATGPLAGLAYRPEVVAAQAVVFVSLLVIAASVSRGVARPLVRWVPAGAGAISLVLAAGWLSATEASRFTQVAAGDVARQCFGQAPEVCVIDESAAAGPAIQQALADLHHAAGSRAELPATYAQVVSGPAPAGARAFVLSPGAVVDGRAVPDVLVTFVVWNHDCLSGDHAPPGRAIELISDLSVVLLSRLEPDRPDPDRLTRLFDRLPPGEQDAWIAAALSASERCAFDEIPDWLDRA